MCSHPLIWDMNGLIIVYRSNNMNRLRGQDAFKVANVTTSYYKSNKNKLIFLAYDQNLNYFTEFIHFVLIKLVI